MSLRVMLCSGNRPEFTAAFLAILAAGMTVFPIAPDIAAPELLSAGQRSGANAVSLVGNRMTSVTIDATMT